MTDRLRLIAENIAQLRTDLTAELVRLGRSPDAVRICGVTKRHPRAAVDAALAAGLLDIGESYVQEAVPKLRDIDGVTKHYIGHIQTNKAKQIVENFDCVQAVDRYDAGLALAKASQALGRGVRILIQVNISPQERYGVAVAEVVDLAEAFRKLELQVDGIMAIGPITEDRNLIRRSFEEAARCFAEVGGSTLSTGMSGDWRDAVACGSTMIRIGTAIFGPREV